MAGWIARVLAALGSQRHKPEADVSYDPARVSKPDGDVAGLTSPVATTTTGTAPGGEFVGRVSGDTAGDAGETGAERRAEDGAP
jgi:hypothetical protein